MFTEIKFKNKSIPSIVCPETTGIRRNFEGKEYSLIKIEKQLSRQSINKNKFKAILLVIETCGFALLTSNFWACASRAWSGKKFVSHYYQHENLSPELIASDNKHRLELLNSITAAKLNAFEPSKETIKELYPDFVLDKQIHSFLAYDTEALIESLKAAPYFAKYLSYTLRTDKGFIKQCLEKGVSPSFLQDIPPSVFQDQVFVFDLIKISGYSFQYFIPSLKDNEVIVKAALDKNIESYLFVSDRLQRTIEWALNYLTLNPKVNIYLLPNALITNKEFMLQAVEISGLVLQGASQELINDEELVNKAMENNIEAYFSASASIQKNINFAKQYIKAKPENLNKLSIELIQNPEIQAIVKASPNGPAILGRALSHIIANQRSR